MAVSRFSAQSFLVRWLVALALVLGTYNPTGYSYYHWLRATESGAMPIKVLVGIGVLILFVIYLRATWRSIGPIGLGLAAGFFGTVIWALIDYDIIDPEKPTLMTYVGLIVLATLMAVGISWSHVRRRVTGQADMDDLSQ